MRTITPADRRNDVAHLFTVADSAAAQAGRDIAVVFPRLVGRNLLGELTTVPVRSRADGYLVLATLSPWDDRAATSWINPARSLFSRQPGIRAFWLQAYPAANPLARWLVRRRLRRSVLDPVMRRITVPVFGESAKLRRELALGPDENVFAFAVRADGEVLAMAAGAWSWDKEARIATAIRHAPVAPQRRVFAA